MPRSALFLLFLLLVTTILAQYDERNIMSQQAYQLLARRQFSEAEELFKQILLQYPDDANSVLQLLQIYYQTTQLDKAEALLNQYRRILPQNQLTEQEIRLLIMQGRAEPAWKLGQTYLQSQNHSQNTYRVLASFFESRGFFEQVLQLYRDARVRLNNQDLFMLEMANSALNYRQYGIALNEYLRFLDKNPANLYFINNQCRTIIGEDSTQIAVIEEYATQSGSAIINELLANTLVFLKRPAQALDIYKTLPQDKILRFAEEQYSALNDEVALPAYTWLSEATDDLIRKNDYRLRQAMIQYRNRRHPEAELILRKIITDSLMLDPKHRLRSDVNLKARKLMAENSIAQSGGLAAAFTWYNEAKRFSRIATETQDIDLAIARLKISAAEFNAARSILLSVNDKTLTETRNFLLFLTELMQGNTDLADSLMNEYVIMQPAGKYVNDSIYLMMFVLGLNDSDREGFFTAYRKMQLQENACVDSMQSLYERNQDEELLILAVEWAIMLSDGKKALTILDREWADPVASDYAALLKLMLTTEPEQQQRLAREFLTANPNSIFSPKFRQSLSKANYSRPEY